MNQLSGLRFMLPEIIPVSGEKLKDIKVKLLVRDFWFMWMGRKGNGVTNLKSLGEYFSKD